MSSRSSRRPTEFSPAHRDTRLARAIHVQHTYTIQHAKTTTRTEVYHIQGGTNPYRVRLPRRGLALPPTCTCPDATKDMGLGARAVAGYCKHILATAQLMQRDDLILPLLLR